MATVSVTTTHDFDTIGDFTICQDLIGLSGLSFSQLEITQIDHRGTIIKNLLAGEPLVVGWCE